MEPADRLESWKEIAAYLKRDVRTVQRWEAFESLPVHRHQHKKRGSVYAHPAELDAWRDSRRAELFAAPDANAVGPPHALPIVVAAPFGKSVLPWVGVATAVLVSIVAVAVWTGESRPTPATVNPDIAMDAPRLFGEILRDGATLQRIPIAGDGGDVALTPDGNTLFVSLCGPGTSGLQAIDVPTQTVKWRIDGLSGCTPLVASARADRLFLPDNTDIVIVDSATQAIRRIRTPAARLSDLALAPDDRTLYVAAVFTGLLVVDTETGDVHTMSRLPCPVNLALTPSGDRLYVNYQCSGPGGSRGHDALEVFDTRTNKSVGIIKGLPNVGGDVAVTPDGSQVWADGRDACKSAYYDQLGCPPGRGAIVNVIRTSDHTLLRSLRVGATGDFGARLSFVNNGSRVVMSSAQTTVVSTESLMEMESYPQPLLGNVVFSPDGRTAYAVLGDAKSIAVLPLAQRPAAPPGLTARWMFDGNGIDAAGGNEIGPLAPEAFAPGRLGLSLRLGDTPAPRLAPPFNLDLDRGHLTIMAWVKFTPVTDARDRPMTMMEYVTTNPDGSSGWTLARGPDGHASVCVGRFEQHRCDPAASSLVRGATFLAPDRWHHVAITRAGETLSLYVNGRRDGAGRINGTVPPVNTLWLRLGSDGAGASPLAGRLDEIEIYSRALTPQEITSRGK